MSVRLPAGAAAAGAAAAVVAAAEAEVVAEAEAGSCARGFGALISIILGRALLNFGAASTTTDPRTRASLHI